MSFTDRLMRKRLGLEDIPGFAGGNLQGQIDEEQPQEFRRNPPPTMADQAISRAVPEDVTQNGTRGTLPTTSPNVPQAPQGGGFQDRLMSRPRVADPVSFDNESLRDIENRPLTTRDKIGMVVQGVARTLGTDPLPTRRQQEIGRKTGQLGRDLAVEKAKREQEQGQMVPFQLPDGSTTMVPAKTAGSLASRQQGQQGNLSIRRRQLEAHGQRWAGMGAHEAAQDAQRLYNSGAADDNEDLRDEIAKRMGLPVGTKLPASSQGQVGVDANGNFILINKRSGVEKPVTQPDSTKPVGSMQGAAEQGRERRFNTGQANRMTIAGNSQAGADRRAGMRGTGTTADRPTMRRAAELVGKIEQARQAMTAADARLAKDPNSRQAQQEREAARGAGEGWAKELGALNAGYEAGPGEKGYPYYKKVEQATPAQPTAQGGSPSTHGFSISGWLARNPGKSEADARAFHDNDERYRTFKIIP